jgi:hypothetical protein
LRRAAQVEALRVVRLDARRIRKQMPTADDLTVRMLPVSFPPTAGGEARIAQHQYVPVGPLTYHPFGFVSGCVWGDDSSWKLQYLDLSRAAEGILRREERFGYLELPDKLPLERVVDLTDFQSNPIEGHDHRIRFTITKQFDLRTGAPVDPLA